MRLLSPALLIWLPLAAAAAGAAEPACRDSVYTGDLAPLFVAPEALGGDWDTVKESPTDPAEDPELHAAGVRAARSLHYTRPRPDGSEACSLEIWSFATPAAARRALPEVGGAAWRIDPLGSLLLMTRGTTLSRQHGFRPGLLPECQRLADLARDHAREILRCTDSR